MLSDFLKRLTSWFRKDPPADPDPADDDEDDPVEECTMWCTMMELRYERSQQPIATQDERLAHDVFTFCGILDSELMTGLLAQPAAKLQAMRTSLLALGLNDQAENAAQAAAALAASGLRLDRAPDRTALEPILKPFEDRYMELRLATYERLRAFIQASPAFQEYAEAIIRADRQGLHIYDPEVWDK